MMDSRCCWIVAITIADNYFPMNGNPDVWFQFLMNRLTEAEDPQTLSDKSQQGVLIKVTLVEYGFAEGFYDLGLFKTQLGFFNWLFF